MAFTKSSPTVIRKNGVQVQADAFHKVIRKLVQQDGRRIANGVSALTNNSGGTASSVAPAAAFVGGAASGSNLADKTTSEAAFNTVLDALGELFNQANAIATAIGITTVTNSAGGTSPDKTIGAITTTVTGATTGILVSNSNTFLTALNNAFYNCAALVNKVCLATGNSAVNFSAFKNYALLTTVPAITISGGTAATPGVLATEANAALLQFQTNVKTLAAALIAAQSTTSLLVIAG
jgi:hypothetical protein